MKKGTMLIAAILMAITVSGQVKGVDLVNAVEVKNDDELYDHVEEWVEVDAGFAFVIGNTHAVDFKHLITELDRILKANGLDINEPDTEDDLLPPAVDGITDYSSLSTWVGMGEAEIIRSYYFDNGWILGIICNYQVQALFLSQVEE